VIQQRLISILPDAARAAASELGLEPGSIPTPELTRPKQKKFGDWSTNLALVLAAQAGKREVHRLLR